MIILKKTLTIHPTPNHFLLKFYPLSYICVKILTSYKNDALILRLISSSLSLAILLNSYPPYALASILQFSNP